MSLMQAITLSSIPTESELKSYQIIAKVAASNRHWRKLGGEGSDDTIVATILSVMLLARELGIPPMQAISGGINNIQGKFEMSARIMNQLIRKHGHKIAIKTSTDELCVIWSKRKDTGEEHEEKYHIQEAARAGLIKNDSGWKKSPKDMLFARCISRLARRLYPDCIGGCYVEGELQETIQGKIVESVEIPPTSEMDIVTHQEPIILALPDHIARDRAEQFLQESSKQTNASVEKLKERANKNMDKFLQLYQLWEDSQIKIEQDVTLTSEPVEEFV